MMLFWHTVKPVLRGYLWKKWAYKTGNLLKEIQFIWNVTWQGKKRWPLNTDDCLIEVTACAGLTIWNFAMYVTLKIAIFLSFISMPNYFEIKKKLNQIFDLPRKIVPNWWPPILLTFE
jgi:hypothetical protein